MKTRARWPGSMCLWKRQVHADARARPPRSAEDIQEDPGSRSPWRRRGHRCEKRKISAYILLDRLNFLIRSMMYQPSFSKHYQKGQIWWEMGLKVDLTTPTQSKEFWVTYLHFSSPFLIGAKTTTGARVWIIMNIAKGGLHILLGENGHVKNCPVCEFPSFKPSY